MKWLSGWSHKSDIRESEGEIYQSWEMKWLCGWAFKSDIRERERVRERDIRVARWSGWVVDLTRVISEIVREEDIRVVRLSGWSLKKLLESERENIYLEDYEIVVDWWNLHSIIRMSNFCFILLICSRNHIWMFGRKRIWRFAKWLSGLDFFIIKSSSEKLPDHFVDLHTVMLPQ